MLAVDAPEDHSLQGVSVAPGVAPKLPGRAAGRFRAPVCGLTTLLIRNLHHTCFCSVQHQCEALADGSAKILRATLNI